MRRGQSPLALGRSVGNLARVVPAASRKPFWLLPSLLSLDAPLVAMAWLYVFAKTWRLGYHPWVAYATLGFAVWSVRTADRLLLASLAEGPEERMDPRLRFHRRHSRVLRAGLVAAVAAAVYLVVTGMPMAIYKHLLLCGLLVAGFFGLSMLSSQNPREVPLSRDITAGLALACATATAAHVYRSEFGIADMLASREFLCFSVLCILNISAVDLWEHASRCADPDIKAGDELSLTLPLTLLGGASLACALLDSEHASRPFFHALLTGAGLLYVLNRQRHRFPADALQPLAHLSLLAPVLVFIIASRPAFR
jgi:hypothetical protein